MSGGGVKLDATAVLVVVGLGVAGFVAWKLYKVGPGLLSGDNTLTRSATNAQGQPVTAYQGQGVAGAIGAATNAASGGLLASAGEWIGGKLADLRDAVSGAPRADAPTVAGAAQAANTGTATATRYSMSGTVPDDPAASWADMAGMPPGFGFPSP